MMDRVTELSPYSFYDKVKTWWNWLAPSCGDIVYNTWYKFAIKKVCCTENTYYPVRALGCKDLMGDIDGMLLKNFSADSIFYACEWKEGVEPNFPTFSSNTHQNVSLLFSHVPISCTILGINIVSWNLSGLCNHEKRLTTTTISSGSSNAMTITRIDADRINEIIDRKDIAIKFIQEQLENKVDVICLQELFLTDRLTHTDGTQLLKEFCGSYSKYTVLYDGFIGGIIIRTSLLETDGTRKSGGKRKLKSKIKQTSRKGGGSQMTVFPPNQDNKISVIKIKKNSMYIVNVCLSPLYHLPKQHLHDLEMRYVMDHLHLLKAFSTGVVFIGDHKHNLIDFYRTIRPESSKRE